MPRRSVFDKGVKTVKTSIELPEDLWQEAKIRSMVERKNLQDIVAEALKSFLQRGQVIHYLEEPGKR
jgi:hypothetical protein